MSDLGYLAWNDELDALRFLGRDEEVRFADVKIERSKIEPLCELLPKTPLTEQVWDAYLPSREPIRTQDYQWHSTLARLKR